MKAREIMTRNLIGVNDDAKVEDAARQRTRNRISGLPVINSHGMLVGLVTEHDLIKKKDVPSKKSRRGVSSVRAPTLK